MHAARPVSLPNGLGLDHPGEDGDPVVTGVAPNEVHPSADRDAWWNALTTAMFGPGWRRCMTERSEVQAH